MRIICQLVWEVKTNVNVYLFVFLQVNARTELAIRYNDISPLENHHCAVAFDIISQVTLQYSHTSPHKNLGHPPPPAPTSSFRRFRLKTQSAKTSSHFHMNSEGMTYFIYHLNSILQLGEKLIFFPFSQPHCDILNNVGRDVFRTFREGMIK